MYSLIQTVSQWSNLTEMQLLYVGILCVVVCVLSILWISQKKSKALTKQLEKLQKDLIASNSTTIGMGQKLIHLEKQLQADQRKSKLSNSSLKDTTEKAAIKFSSSFTQAIEASNSNPPPKTESINKLSLVKNDSLEKSSVNVSEEPDKEVGEMPSDEAYEQSRRLLSQGVDISEIVKQSGLSYSEVSLMQKLAR